MSIYLVKSLGLTYQKPIDHIPQEFLNQFEANYHTLESNIPLFIKSKFYDSLHFIINIKYDFQCLKDGDIINVVCCSEMSNSEIAKINCTFKAVVDSIALPDIIINLDDWKPEIIYRLIH